MEKIQEKVQIMTEKLSIRIIPDDWCKFRRFWTSSDRFGSTLDRVWTAEILDVPDETAYVSSISILNKTGVAIASQVTESGQKLCILGKIELIIGCVQWTYQNNKGQYRYWWWLWWKIVLHCANRNWKCSAWWFNYARWNIWTYFAHVGLQQLRWEHVSLHPESNVCTKGTAHHVHDSIMRRCCLFKKKSVTQFYFSFKVQNEL